MPANDEEKDALDNFNALFDELVALEEKHAKDRIEMQAKEDALRAKLEEARGGLAQPLVVIKATGTVSDKQG